MQARPNQLTPEGAWRTWLVLAGRGWGKTRCGAEDVAHFGMTHAGARIAVVAPTFSDARDTCVEGESGLLACLPQGLIDKWNRSIGEIRLKNGTLYRLYSSEEPDRLRGPQQHRAWCDEVGAWRAVMAADGYGAWEMLQMGLRLGDGPQTVVTTTPKPTALIRRLASDPSVHITRGTTYENLKNLAPAYRDIVSQFEGTRLGRQELHAEILDDIEGALWSRAMVDAARAASHPDLTRVVVAIDPAASSGASSDETGIIVAGLGVDGHGYVLADLTCRLSPDGWARRAVGAYYAHKADRIVAEVNNGGEMVAHTIRTVDHDVPYRAVHASRGKIIRAEPVAALYEQGKIHHVGALDALEDQMTSFTPDNIAGISPDRVDALVWALTDLMVTGKRVAQVAPPLMPHTSGWRVG